MRQGNIPLVEQGGVEKATNVKYDIYEHSDWATHQSTILKLANSQSCTNARNIARTGGGLYQELKDRLFLYGIGLADMAIAQLSIQLKKDQLDEYCEEHDVPSLEELKREAVVAAAE